MTSIDVEQKSDGRRTLILAGLSRKKLVVEGNGVKSPATIGAACFQQVYQALCSFSSATDLWMTELQAFLITEEQLKKVKTSNRVNSCCATGFAGIWYTTRALHAEFICKVSSPTKKAVPLAQSFKIRKPGL